MYVENYVETVEMLKTLLKVLKNIHTIVENCVDNVESYSSSSIGSTVTFT